MNRTTEEIDTLLSWSRSTAHGAPCVGPGGLSRRSMTYRWFNWLTSRSSRVPAIESEQRTGTLAAIAATYPEL